MNKTYFTYMSNETTNNKKAIIKKLKKLANSKINSKYKAKTNIINYYLINSLIVKRRCKYLISYYEILIDNLCTEYLKRLYFCKEINFKIKKLNEYYVHYCRFFLIPMLLDLKANTILQNNADIKADLYCRYNIYPLKNNINKDLNTNSLYNSNNKMSNFKHSSKILNNKVLEYIEDPCLSFESLSSNYSIYSLGKNKHKLKILEKKSKIY